MAKLRWNGDFTVDERFVIQTERIRGEGVWYYLMKPEGLDIDRLCERYDIERTFFGQGGKAKVKAAAQRISDILDSA